MRGFGWLGEESGISVLETRGFQMTVERAEGAGEWMKHGGRSSPVPLGDSEPNARSRLLASDLFAQACVRIWCFSVRMGYLDGVNEDGALPDGRR